MAVTAQAAHLWLPKCGFRLVAMMAASWLLVPPVHSQDTLGESSCQFRGYDNNIYNIEMRREVWEKPCPVETLTSKFKDNENKVQELLFEVAQLQSLMLRLLDVNQSTVHAITTLENELRTAKEALRLSQAAATECPPQYDVHNDELRSCYMFVGRDLTWYEAETFCMSTGGHLVSLETEAEQTFVVNYIRSSRVLPGNHMWTGGNDIAKEGEWMWAGINQPFSNYTKWLLYPHESQGAIQMPDNDDGLEHCVHLFHLHNYEWNDIYCGRKFYFICEYKLL